MAQLKNLASNLWIVDQPDFSTGIAKIGTRMTVIKLASGGLFLHSPTKLDDETKRALDAIGEVRAVVAPSRAHHMFVGDYIKDLARCEALRTAGSRRRHPGFPRPNRRAARSETRRYFRRRGPNPNGQAKSISTCSRARWAINEVVFFHRASRSAIFTDLVFNVPADFKEARIFYTLVGGRGHFGPHRLIRMIIRDHKAARESVAKILEWDFDRVIVTHGDVLESGGKAKFADAFSYL